ncbi:MAG: trypsin-like peptidase domain-containing protein [Candidatus Izemoplasma sp.]
MKKILLIVTLVFTITLAGCIPADDTNSYTDEELRALIEELIPEVDATIDTTYDLSSFNDAIVDMISVARTGVIGIINETATGSSSGSGVVYKHVGDTYYVVTNHHVVEDSLYLSVIYEKNGLLFEITDDKITLLGSDPTTDLAVFTFTSTEEFTVIELADSYEVELGQFVFAIGNPLGFDYYGTVTMGVVSGLARYVQDGDFDATLLQHDAAISPGNSGGALLNINGELIGINNMKIVDADVSSIGFAIPSNTVKRIIEDLEDDGIIIRPYLGISTSAQVNVCGLDYGVCILVAESGGAFDAGLEDGDIIIGYKNDGSTEYLEILNFNDLREAILNSQVGEQIQIEYVRGGVIYDSNIVILGVHPDDE